MVKPKRGYSGLKAVSCPRGFIRKGYGANLKTKKQERFFSRSLTIYLPETPDAA